jgi:hypothetical protein
VPVSAADATLNPSVSRYLLIAAWQVSHQRVEYLRSPALGIDVPKPRFGWVVEPGDGEAGEGVPPSRTMTDRDFPRPDPT